jgi:hypothetical protein
MSSSYISSKCVSQTLPACSATVFSYDVCNMPGVYIFENTPPGGEFQPMSFGGKILKGEEKKGENVREKGRKGKEQGRKGKENEKRGRKRVK